MSDKYYNAPGFLGWWRIKDKTHPFFQCGRQHDFLYERQLSPREVVDSMFFLCMDKQLEMLKKRDDISPWVIADLERYRDETTILVKKLGWLPWYKRKILRFLRLA